MSDDKWRAVAACKGVSPSLFFPTTERERAESLPHVQRICKECPVKSECVNDAVVTRDFHGYRGGLTPAELRRVARRRNRRE